MMLSSVFGSRRGVEQKTFVEECCILVRAQLTAWEYKFNKAHPTHKPTTIQKITSAHIGVPARRLLKLKAAEMKYFFFFLHAKLQEAWTSMHNGQLWLEGSRAMWDLLNELDEQPWKLSDEQVEEHL